MEGGFNQIASSLGYVNTETDGWKEPNRWETIFGRLESQQIN